MKAKQKKILIAEDEKPMARALELKLGHAGFAIQIVSDGQMVLEILGKTHFDLLLLDLMMPNMDGFQVLEEMKSRNMKTPVIVLSNLSQPEDRDKVKALGAKSFYVKSDTPISDIITHIQTALGRGA